jgi:hypothetical protein
MSYSQSRPEVAAAQAGHGEEVSRMEPDDIGVGLLTVLFSFVAVVVLLIVVLLQAWFYNWRLEALAQWSPIDVQQAPAAIAQKQLERIDRYGWVDPETKKGRAIRIGRAMELVVKELGGETAAPAGPGKETRGK